MSTGIRGKAASAGIAFVQSQDRKITLHLTERVTAREVTEQDGLVSSSDAWLILIQDHGTAQQRIEGTRVRARLEQRPAQRIHNTHEGSAGSRIEDPACIVDVRRIEGTIDADEIRIADCSRSSRSCADRGTRHDALHVARGRTPRNHAGSAAPVPFSELIPNKLIEVKGTILQFRKTHLHNTRRAEVRRGNQPGKNRVCLRRCHALTNHGKNVCSVILKCNLHRAARVSLLDVQDGSQRAPRLLRLSQQRIERLRDKLRTARDASGNGPTSQITLLNTSGAKAGTVLLGDIPKTD